MRRKEILDAVDQILSALRESEIYEMLEAKLGEGKSSSDVKIKLLESLRIYNIRTQSFNKAAKNISSILHLNILEDTEIWLGLTTDTQTIVAVNMYHNIRFALEHLPKITRLLEHELLNHFQEGSSEATSKYRGMRTLTLYLFEEDNVLSSPARLSNALESIEHFYTTCAFLSGESPNTISVIACDSGSDKSFDFLGIAKVMDCVERLIETLFERIFFFREHQFEERLDLVKKALPIIHQIKKMEEHEELEPEMAEILRRNVFDGANKFIQAGGTISKIEDKSQYDARSLLSPVQKLLVAAPEESTAENSPEHSKEENVSTLDDSSLEEKGAGHLELNNLSEEEQRELLRLVQKSRSVSPKIESTNELETSDEELANEIENESEAE